MSDLERALLTTPVLKFVVPGEPQGQAEIKSGTRSDGSRYSYHGNKKLEPWRNDAIVYIKNAMRRERLRCLDRSVPVLVVTDFYFKRPKNPSYSFPKDDVDHNIRALGDSMKKAKLLTDDAQVIEWRARKHYGEPRTEVTVWVEAA